MPVRLSPRPIAGFLFGLALSTPAAGQTYTSINYPGETGDGRD
jgi:hypothetical protein